MVYRQIPAPDDPMFGKRAHPTHKQLTEVAESMRTSLLGEGLLTPEELDRLSQQEAIELAVKRWKDQNPTWPELPPQLADD
jgi:hypothetical protein